MGHPSIDDRLKIVSKMIQQHEDLREYIKLKKKILQAQLLIDKTANKGAKSDWSKQLSITYLEKKSLETKKPIVHFLNPEIFDVDTLISVFKKSSQAFISNYPENKGLRTLRDHIELEPLDLVKWIKAVLTEDEKLIISYAKKFVIEPSILLFLVNTTLQPFIEEITRRVSPSFYDKWWRARCPICGMIPSVARIRNRRRYLICNYCGAEYLSDHFLCVYCGNKDPYTLKYIKIEGKPEFQIDFCSKCKNYTKVIVENALREPIPRFLEDMLTLDLDIQAKHAGLIRHVKD